MCSSLTPGGRGRLQQEKGGESQESLKVRVSKWGALAWPQPKQEGAPMELSSGSGSFTAVRTRWPTAGTGLVLLAKDHIGQLRDT